MNNKWLNKEKNIFFVLLAAFLIFRLLILFTSFDELYDSEELYRGAIANEIIEGRSLPLLDYLYTDYEGGSLIIGICAVPFFFLFGKSYLSLKMATFLISALIFSLWYWIFNKYFNLYSAVVFSLLMLFPVPSLLKISLTSWGNHFESALFSTFIIFFILKAIYEDNTKRQNLYTAFAGISFGFGTFFSYSLLPQAAAIFISLLLLRYRFLLKKFYLLVLSSLIGFLPGIYFNLTHNFAGFRIKGKSLNQIIAPTTPKGGGNNRFINFIISKIPQSSCLSGDSFIKIDGAEILISFIYLISFILTFVFVLNIFLKERSQNLVEKKDGRLFITVSILLYPILFALSYSITSFHISSGYKDYFGFRYMTPFMLYLIFIITISVFFLMSYKRLLPKALSILIPALTIFINSNFDLKLIDFKEPVNAASYKGYNYFWLGQVIVFRYGFELSKSLEAIQKLHNCAKAESFEGLGFKYGWAFLSRTKEEEKKLNGIETKFLKRFYKGLGLSLYYYNGNWSTSETLQKTVKDKIPAMFHNDFYNGFGILMPYNRSRSYESFFLSYDKSFSDAIAEGIGEGIITKRGLNLKKAEKEAKKLPAPLKSHALIGIKKKYDEMVL